MSPEHILIIHVIHDGDCSDQFEKLGLDSNPSSARLV